MVVLLTGIAYANVDKGWDAFDKGDFKTSFKEWEILASQGDSEAQYLLGKSYDNGTGTLMDRQKALYWFKESAEQGYVEAQSALGMRYSVGDTVDEDDEEAIFWHLKAAKQGNANSQAMLGMAYGMGDGVLKDMPTAKYWTKKAYDSDNAFAHQQAKRFWELLELWKY